ncbi:MAG: hypothetical protein K8R87_12000 [Verrucomicrobia bacterium]|nr:hypothetical protein [Verrucomicrobiota bacterium]
MNYSRSFGLAMALAMIGTAQAAWNRLPITEARQFDLAEESIPGTELISSSSIGNAKALVSKTLMDDVNLSAGKSNATLRLHKQQNVSTIAFTNDGAEGGISITGSSDNKNWFNLGSAVFTGDDRVVQVHLATATAKYISLAFESAKGGTIRSFEIFGTSTDNDFKLVPTGEGEGGTSINLVDVRNSRPIYAFPTPTNMGELNEFHNKFVFPKSKEKYRTIVYDLGETRTVKYFATTYSQRPVRVEIFTFEELPEKKDWRGKLTLDPEIFNNLKPTAVGEDPKGIGHIKITPGKSISVRYVALRFEPDYQRSAAVSLLDFSLKDLVAATAGSFGIISDNFSPPPQARFAAVNDGTFVVSDVEVISLGNYQQVPNDGSNQQGGQQGNQQNNQVVENTGNNYNGGGFGGYYPYTGGGNGAQVPVNNDQNNDNKEKKPKKPKKDKPPKSP